MIRDAIINRPAEAFWAALEVFKAKRPRLFRLTFCALLACAAGIVYAVAR